MRVRFLDKDGQRNFIKLVLMRTNCPSLRDFKQFGFDVPYSTMKNYYSCARLLPRDLFEKMCYLGKIDTLKLDVQYLDDNWGKVKGGIKSKKQ